MGREFITRQRDILKKALGISAKELGNRFPWSDILKRFAREAEILEQCVLIQKSISCTARSHSLFSNAGRNPPPQNPQSFSCNETEPPFPQPAAIGAAKKRITMTQKKRAWVPIWRVVGAIFSF
jgi:hypothetical protein